MGFNDKYRLELHCEEIEKSDGVALLRRAYFCGPVLKIAKEINCNDNIVLDFTPQYSKILSNYYFATLSWGNVDYVGEKVFLFNCTLSGDFVNSVSEFDDSDYIVIDTELHEENTHVFNLVYPSLVVNSEGEEHC
jgi:hypothetical protein